MTQFKTQDFTITSGGAVPTAQIDGTAADGALAVPEKSFGSVLFPAAMTGTKLLIQHKYAPGGTWVAAVDEDGTQYQILKRDSKSCRIPNGAFGAPFMRFISDATEGADRAFTVHLIGL